MWKENDFARHPIKGIAQNVKFSKGDSEMVQSQGKKGNGRSEIREKGKTFWRHF